MLACPARGLTTDRTAGWRLRLVEPSRRSENRGWKPSCRQSPTLKRFESDAESLMGGPEYARRLLEEAVGSERAQAIMSGGTGSDPDAPSLASILETTSPSSLAAHATACA